MRRQRATQHSSFVSGPTLVLEHVVSEEYSEILGQKLEDLYFDLLRIPLGPTEGRGTVVRLWRGVKRAHSIEMYSPWEGIRMGLGEEWSVTRVDERLDVFRDQVNQRLSETNTRLLHLDEKLDRKFDELRKEMMGQTQELRKEIMGQNQFKWLLVVAAVGAFGTLLRLLELIGLFR